MFQRYVFVAVCSVVLSGLGIWSAKIEAHRHQRIADVEYIKSQGQAESPSAVTEGQGEEHGFQSAAQQREILETLERIVSYEHYYRSVYGHFTKILSRTGVSIPRSVASAFEIRVSEATTERLLITAFSEVDGRTIDQVSIDEDYLVKASFTLPPPRSEYLQLQATKYLRRLLESPEGQVPSERSVFRGFFKYEVRRDSQNRKIAFAVGIRPPVLGNQIEVDDNSKSHVVSLAPNADLNGEMEDLLQIGGRRTGQQVEVVDPSNSTHSPREDAYLAQKIFHGEIGRYARSWSELSKIANFQLDEKGEAAPTLEPIPQRKLASRDLDAKPRNFRKKDSFPAGSGALEIEPISADQE